MKRKPVKKASRLGLAWLAISAWLNSGLHNLGMALSDLWERIRSFFRIFRLRGFVRLIVELVDEGFSLALAGIFVLLLLAQPAFKMTQSNWRERDNFSVEFFDRHGKSIGRRGNRLAEVIEVPKLPDQVLKAVMATEDRRFYQHWGIDFIGLIRAMGENVKASSVVQGGSTITQQLAKNLFLTNERTLERKIHEAFLALWLEVNLSKNEIMKLYLERAYLGGGTFGISAASEFYFGKKITDVSLAEAAMLAGLFKAPSQYAPHIDLPAARARANAVLTGMVQAGFLTEGQVVSARKNPATPIDRKPTYSPNYFLDWAFDEVRRIGADHPHRLVKAKTTIDIELQKLAEKTATAFHRKFARRYGFGQFAMVVMDHTGAVRAMVGGRDYGKSQFNRATRSRRQPGSSFKPFVYASSIDEFGLTRNTRIRDERICVGRTRQWCPRNYSGGYAGWMPLERALIKSYNTVPVKLYLGRREMRGRGIGGEKIVENLDKLGVSTKGMVVNPTMVLGSNGLSVLDMATGYGVFMGDGRAMRRHGIMQLTTDNENAQIYYDFRRHEPSSKRVFKEETIATMNRIMAQIPEWGTARRANLGTIRAAGKTGTTSAYRDAWYVGYTGNYVAAIWLGNDNYRPTRRMTGGSVPAMIWQNFMLAAHRNIELRPVPYINKPFSGEASKRGTRIASPIPVGPTIRQKLLSRESESQLRLLGVLLRRTEPIATENRVDETATSSQTSQIN